LGYDIVSTRAATRADAPAQPAHLSVRFSYALTFHAHSRLRRTGAVATRRAATRAAAFTAAGHHYLCHLPWQTRLLRGGGGGNTPLHLRLLPFPKLLLARAVTRVRLLPLFLVAGSLVRTP